MVEGQVWFNAVVAYFSTLFYHLLGQTENILMSFNMASGRPKI